MSSYGKIVINDFYTGGKRVDKIRIHNLRSLYDTNYMDIKPINILVGGNSSGKSTFLRLFPLMKQSLGEKINGPILWAGDKDEYVDFGSFSEALNNRSEEKKIKFGFEFMMEVSKDFHNWTDPFRSNYEKYPINVEFSLEKFKESDLDYISEVKIQVFNATIFIRFNEKKYVEAICINERRYDLPEMELLNNRFYFGAKPIFDIPVWGLREFAETKLKKVLEFGNEESHLYRGNLGQLANYLLYRNIIGAQIEYNKDMDEDIKKYDDKKFAVDEINDLILIWQLPYIYQNISMYLSAYFRNVYYIAPVRATAGRYYRLRNVAVNEIDCRGENLAVFLNSLSGKQMQEFQDWTEENLGFRVEKSLSIGHVSLQIRKKGSSKSVNLSDSGFGYSQILPIITQLWYIANEDNNVLYYMYMSEAPITFAIEQPELHLHPGLQARLVDVMLKVMKNSKREIRFVLETHSETIINRLGNLIYKNKLSKEEVGIFIFDKELGDENTKIHFGKYDDEGYLEDWPIGFFEPEEVL